MENARKERLTEIRKAVEEIPIGDIISTRMEIGKDMLCPFHKDEKAGSFQISRAKNIFKCFSCGAAGNGIKFISLYDNIKYTDAFLKIAVEFGIIQNDEYQKLSKEQFNGEIKKFTPKKEKQKKKQAELQEEEIIDYVYSLFSEGNSLINPAKPKLSKDHHEYLLGRNISEEDIEKFGYFTIPSTKIVKKIIQRLNLRGLSKDNLLGVPGFYKQLSTGEYKFLEVDGIGIPIKNVDGLITGIQIRKDKTDGKSGRYTWMSSSFVYNGEDNGLDGGSSPGIQFDVVYPDEVKKKYIFITEGHFKAAEISKAYSCIAVSVQGVSNYKGIESVINTLAERYSLTQIVIAYDADMVHNKEVKKHAGKLADLCVKKCHKNILGAIWDESYGKGMDDVLLSGNKDKIKFVLARKVES